MRPAHRSLALAHRSALPAHRSALPAHRRDPRGTIDATPKVPGKGRTYVSPELGLHFGRDEVLRPGVQLGFEGEAFFDGSPARIQGVAAWTLW